MLASLYPKVQSSGLPADNYKIKIMTVPDICQTFKEICAAPYEQRRSLSFCLIFFSPLFLNSVPYFFTTFIFSSLFCTYPCLSYLYLSKNALYPLQSFANISLACHLIQCMHRKYNNTAVNDIHAIICHDICDGSSAHRSTLPISAVWNPTSFIVIPDALLRYIPHWHRYIILSAAGKLLNTRLLKYIYSFSNASAYNGSKSRTYIRRKHIGPQSSSDATDCHLR